MRAPSRSKPRRSHGGATEQIARDLLPRIPIEEHVTPDFVSIETRRIERLHDWRQLRGALQGEDAERRDDPGDDRERRRVGDGDGRAGHREDDQRRHPGHRDRRLLRSPVGQRRHPGSVRVDRQNGPSELRTVNGGVRVALPEAAKATVSASWVNGGINLSGLQFEVTEQARRRFEGRLNGGGTDDRSGHRQRRHHARHGARQVLAA